MNILLISYLFPPVVNPQSILSARVAKYLQKAGHQVTVLAATDIERYNSSHGVDISLNDDCPGVKTCYVADRQSYGVLTEILKKLVYHERLDYWAKEILKKARPICQSESIDVIYSLAFPMASNVAGMWLRRETDIPWVAHFSDPGFLAFNLRFRSPIRTYLARSIEESIFRYSNGITFVNQETLERNTVFSPFYREKCRVIPHCFDPEYFSMRRETRDVESAIRFSYIGALYGQRNPFGVILALKEAIDKPGHDQRQHEFHLYGAVDSSIQTEIQKHFLFSWVKLHGPVSYRQSIDAMFNSDYLILIDWLSDDNLYFPSKLVDYLAARRPIIGITSPSSFSARLLTDMGYPVFQPSDTAALSLFFSSLMDGTRLDVTPRHLELLDSFRADRVAEQLGDFLQERCLR